MARSGSYYAKGGLSKVALENYRMHENENKRQYSRRVLDMEQGTFTPPVFTTTGGMGKVMPQDSL